MSSSDDEARKEEPSKEEPSKDEHKEDSDVHSPPEKCSKYTLPSDKDDNGASGSVSIPQVPSSVEGPDTKIGSADIPDTTGESPDTKIGSADIPDTTGSSSDANETISADSTTTTADDSPAEKIFAYMSDSDSCTPSCSGEETLKESQKLYLEFSALVKAFEHYRSMEELRKKLDAEQASREDESVKATDRGVSSSSPSESSIPAENIPPAKGNEKQASLISKPMERVLRSRKISISLSPSKSTRAHATKRAPAETAKSDVDSSNDETNCTSTTDEEKSTEEKDKTP